MKAKVSTTPPAPSTDRCRKFKQGRKSITLYLPADLHLVFKEKAYANNRTMAAQLIHFINRFLEGRLET
jgi:hypothetical protein